MRPTLFLLISLLALTGFAADTPAEAPAKKPTRQAKGQHVFPESVTGVDDAELAKIRQALTATFQEEAIVAAAAAERLARGTRERHRQTPHKLADIAEWNLCSNFTEPKHGRACRKSRISAPQRPPRCPPSENSVTMSHALVAPAGSRPKFPGCISSIRHILAARRR